MLFIYLHSNVWELVFELTLRLNLYKSILNILKLQQTLPIKIGQFFKSAPTTRGYDFTQFIPKYYIFIPTDTTEWVTDWKKKKKKNLIITLQEISLRSNPRGTRCVRRRANRASAIRNSPTDTSGKTSGDVYARGIVHRNLLTRGRCRWRINMYYNATTVTTATVLQECVWTRRRNKIVGRENNIIYRYVL